MLVCVYVCMRMCVCACMRMCIHVCMRMYVHVCVRDVCVSNFSCPSSTEDAVRLWPGGIIPYNLSDALTGKLHNTTHTAHSPKIFPFQAVNYNKSLKILFCELLELCATSHMASPSMGVHTVQYTCDTHKRQLSFSKLWFPNTLKNNTIPRINSRKLKEPIW